MPKKSKWKTAAQVLAELHADPAYVAAQKQRDNERNARTLAYHLAEEPIVRDLRAKGIAVASVWDLVASDKDYSGAIPVLLLHLSKDYPDRVREGIARALAVPSAKIGWEVLVSEFEKDPDLEGHGAKAGIALALAASADEGVLPEVIRLLADRRHGASRGLLLLALKRLKPTNLSQLIDVLKDDPDLAVEIRATFLRESRRKTRRS
jgi:hypothetical protein